MGTEKTYTVGLYTLGCKVAQYETEAIAEDFARRGFLVRDFSEACDVYVVNTCTVTAESDRKCRQFIRRAAAQNPQAPVLVCGCYAQTSPKDVLKIEGVAYVCGTGGKMKLAEAALELLRESEKEPVCAVTNVFLEPFERMTVEHAPRTRAYVKIEDGCSCRCTYCAIPLARGSVRSKAPADVLTEVARLAAGGSREVVLTGIETAAYGEDLGNTHLIDLLEMLDKREDTPRIRLGSLSPELVRPDFITRFAKLHTAVPHLHLSMQSGSDNVLRGMRRRYNTAMALASLRALREAIPNVQFTTDLMVGFPGESDADFEETLAFCREARFLDVHVFAYSRRPGTVAADMDGQVPESVKRERSARLIAEKNKIREEILSSVVTEGKPLSVLFETKGKDGWLGHTDSFIEVCVPSEENLSGEIAEVVPIATENGILYGQLK
ncbi:MAG: tRNA (N(6)-L-threonylcarbamoyladenosine(37)-C(2))-methylthiotransferase MtaB [Clostridia bacterium]|nr:tRNA (N(6)-L-threonylcarbamoyladenosine(37)-C(2))-methylthiotransferase MtaB [Clostridia bacterium]